MDERTLSGWVAKADNDGFESLRAVKQKGRSSKLSDEQKEKIKGVIKKDPSVYGYTNWDGPSLSDFISKEFDVEYSIRACQKLFHELGFSLIRPQTYPSLNEPDEDAREAFKKRVVEVFSDPSTILVFQDEVHFSVQSTIMRGWAQKGTEPKVKSYHGRRNASYSGFVVPETGQLWVDKPGWFNFEITVASLKGFVTECPLEEGRR